MHTRTFSTKLQAKIDALKLRRKPLKIGSINFDSPLLLAPMAGICTPNFRLLMEDLGAGGTVSELVSCHGINHGNQRTLDMLKILPTEKNVGIQLFGEDPAAMAQAAQVAIRSNPKFIDINMGCPVKKVVNKGGGSALMREIEKLAPFFATIKKAIDVPLTIKIRMGWEYDDLNADKITSIAFNEGVEWVAIHGRTRGQQYTGKANWEYIEWLKSQSPLPIIGNGDLHTPGQVKQKMANTTCDALMIARGCLRNPFIFLEAMDERNEFNFDGSDYWEIIQRLYDYTTELFPVERTCLVQMRKLIVWFSAGLKGAAAFRSECFAAKTLDETMQISERYFLDQDLGHKAIDYSEDFMMSGHG